MKSWNDLKLGEYLEGRLADDRLELIERWAHQLRSNSLIGPLGLTMRQRRHIASIMWHKKVAESNEHMGVRQPPPPIVGKDAKGRIVVQSLDEPHHRDRVKQYALTREGDPADIYEPVISLRTGEQVRITDRVNVKETK
jgi:hypothetical protein